MTAVDAILHLTDLHFPSSGDNPLWLAAFNNLLPHIAEECGCTIAGIAVTGDLVDSPTKEARKKALEFLENTAEACGVMAHGQPDHEHIWRVGGNHDYKTKGLIPLLQGRYGALEGWLEGNPIYVDSSRGWCVLRIDTGKKGLLARGGTAISNLRKLENALRNIPENVRYRIALVHHHMLPIPASPPEEHNSWRLSQMFEDDAFLLLDNAGLITHILCRNQIDLVLHGHKHAFFAARAAHFLDGQGAEHTMTVLGGTDMNKGFQLVRFLETGEVEVFRYERQHDTYARQPSFPLWSHGMRQEAEWSRQSRVKGTYERMILNAQINQIGDCVETMTIKGIRGGVKPIDHLTPSICCKDPEFGTCAITAAYDLENNRDLSDLPPPKKNEVKYLARLDPPATSTKLHAGLRIQRIAINTIALTQADLCWRKPNANKETWSFGVLYPTRYLILTMKFFTDPELRPSVVYVTAYNKNEHNQQNNLAETQRAAKYLIYNEEEGMVFLAIGWVIPGIEYELSWEVAQLTVLRNDKHRAYLRRLRKAVGKRDREVRNVLMTMRDRIVFDWLSDQSEEVQREEANQIDLGMFVFNENEQGGQILCLAGTYSPNSGFWKTLLPWGVGVRGTALRRGRPEFYRQHGLTATPYSRLDNCPPERYLVAVPISLPILKERVLTGYPGEYRLVVCISTIVEDSKMDKLFSWENDKPPDKRYAPQDSSAQIHFRFCEKVLSETEAFLDQFTK